jgi:hypothetical protein
MMNMAEQKKPDVAARRLTMKAFSLVSLCVAAMCALGPDAAGAQTSSMSMHEQKTRYYGTPDLALTAALVQAGGGAEHFDAAQLVGVLAGANNDAEVSHLTQMYSAERVSQFLRTFTFAIDDSLRIAQSKGIALPTPAPDLSSDGRALSASLFRAGTMPEGHFDIGYMIEHLVSRPIHVQLMNDINADAKYGPTVNSDFHVILTTAMYDLKSAYGL